MWNAIRQAARLVAQGQTTRMEGIGWKVYAVGSNVIRVDLAADDPYIKESLNDRDD